VYYGIKPVIVFDGEAPALKKRTLRQRKERARNAKQKMDDIREEINLIDMASKVQNGVGYNPSIN